MASNTPQENVKPLKMLVFSMGLVLIGGTVLLGVLVVKKVSERSKPPVVQACAGGVSDLKGRGGLADTRIDGNKLRATFRKGAGVEVVTLDLCTGSETGSLKIQADYLYKAN